MMKKTGSVSNSVESPAAEEELGVRVPEFKLLIVQQYHIFSTSIVFHTNV